MPRKHLNFKTGSQRRHDACRPATSVDAYVDRTASRLGELFRAVALFATGGIAALEQQDSTTAGLLLTQIR